MQAPPTWSCLKDIPSVFPCLLLLSVTLPSGCLEHSLTMPKLMAPESLPPTVWIFGYGSLIWNTGFDYDESMKTIARGYSLRMYQGNKFHRGDHKLPGRVATLIENKQSYACGLAFRVSGSDNIKAALKHLHDREVENGYELSVVALEPFEAQDAEESPSRIMALTYIATAKNQFYLGPGPLDQMGEQITQARGCAGPNTEYLFRLVDSIRTLFPNYCDEHIFALERHTMERHRMRA